MLRTPIQGCVLTAHRIPEGDIERIELAIFDGRLIARQSPVLSVGRDEGHQDTVRPFAGISQSLVALLGWSVRVAVLEGGKAAGGLPFPDDVVVLGSLELDQTE